MSIYDGIPQDSRKMFSMVRGTLPRPGRDSKTVERDGNRRTSFVIAGMDFGGFIRDMQAFFPLNRDVGGGPKSQTNPVTANLDHHHFDTAVDANRFVDLPC